MSHVRKREHNSSLTPARERLLKESLPQSDCKHNLGTALQLQRVGDA